MALLNFIDTGFIIIGEDSLTVLDCQKSGEEIHHICSGDFNNDILSDPVSCKIDFDRRQRIRKNHTATHLLHAALKKTLGEQVSNIKISNCRPQLKKILQISRFDKKFDID